MPKTPAAASSRAVAFLNSERGSIVASVIVGLGLATLFQRVCKGAGCVVRRGPPPEDLRHVYRVDGRCYKYTRYAASCDSTSAATSKMSAA
jgi:hypothetical protein